ncbi:hypothetical protein DSAG12_02849 [Promethearchaeum syntrophicum]|uniref:Uncharacterized protein n=1 Tax=Promethearchaeum syntrophicum TaxID=2594042 RepID=A0A5B9DDQ9_9ARCH|nr:hypothetical protein [Candidatus Prometheoarchaeum syntrophicum]
MKEKINLDFIRNQIIGRNLTFETPFGKRTLIYTDYSSSGSGLRFIESYLQRIQKIHAISMNSGNITEKILLKLLQQAEYIIKSVFNADDDCLIVPTGINLSDSIQKFQEIIGIRNSPEQNQLYSEKPTFFIGPFEKQMYKDIWDNSFAEIVEIKLIPNGDIDLKDLEAKLSSKKYKGKLKVGIFSAGSEISGKKYSILSLTNILHKYDAFSYIDYSSFAPYVQIEESVDALFVNGSNFIGGLNSTGMLVIKPDVIISRSNSPKNTKLTPNSIFPILKAALAISTQTTLYDEIVKTEELYFKKAYNRLSKNDRILILKNEIKGSKIPFFSIMIKYKEKYLHQGFIAKLLNDLFGIQASIKQYGDFYEQDITVPDKIDLTLLEFELKQGYRGINPGWVYFNLHYILSEIDIDYICNAIDFIAKYGYLLISSYEFNLVTGEWTHIKYEKEEDHDLIGDLSLLEIFNSDLENHDIAQEKRDRAMDYEKYIQKANKLAINNELVFSGEFSEFEESNLESLHWFYFKNLKK